MGDYTPVAFPGDAVTATTSAGVTGGQCLKVSGSNTVAPAGALDTVVGVAAFDAASGAQVTYYAERIIHETLNAGGVTAGDQLAAGAAGAVASLPAASAAAAADVNKARAVIGVALATAADAVVVRWMAFT